ncbi:hypothetical protein [Rhodovarius crocodyli]|uniref:hypothetical protein n=1 Tax=Rhodovarius crocodyli TaxID=1979269 RepID=UPI0013E299F8|nr:hypothetical protein [Rhodovarius crocodyli]
MSSVEAVPVIHLDAALLDEMRDVARQLNALMARIYRAQGVAPHWETPTPAPEGDGA